MADTKPFMEENDVLKQFMELLNQQNMREQSQDFMELFKYRIGSRACGEDGTVIYLKCPAQYGRKGR